MKELGFMETVMNIKEEVRISRIRKCCQSQEIINNSLIEARGDISRDLGGARGVVVIVVGNEHGDTSSNPERG